VEEESDGDAKGKVGRAGRYKEERGRQTAQVGNTGGMIRKFGSGDMHLRAMQRCLIYVAEPSFIHRIALPRMSLLERLAVLLSRKGSMSRASLAITILPATLLPLLPSLDQVVENDGVCMNADAEFRHTKAATLPQSNPLMFFIFSGSAAAAWQGK
jgi:hypothetical protein